MNDWKENAPTTGYGQQQQQRKSRSCGGVSIFNFIYNQTGFFMAPTIKHIRKHKNAAAAWRWSFENVISNEINQTQGWQTSQQRL